MKKVSGLEEVVGALDPGKPRTPRYRVAHKDGKVVRLRVLDVDSPDFTAELTDAFRKSVRKARAENRQVVNAR